MSLLETYYRVFLEGKEREFIVEGMRQRGKLQEDEVREGGCKALCMGDSVQTVLRFFLITDQLELGL